MTEKDKSSLGNILLTRSIHAAREVGKSALELYLNTGLAIADRLGNLAYRRAAEREDAQIYSAHAVGLSESIARTDVALATRTESAVPDETEEDFAEVEHTGTFDE